MKLKSLVLSGFKSFPNRTVLNFSQGVSAIVGPNGSGKSNIVDAIRWVLGEQNPRMLRAEKMEELIFSGNSAKPVEAARVKLRLTECQDMAPPELKEFPEIDIERMLFRDGTSKFLLNGKSCRLKEIRYLFLDTGTGARAYSIIDQGRVGQFVTMTPEERRLIIEEAAGIARYRDRRIQALARMNSTLDNLQRLEDVISEVERQARGLKRQAKKAEAFTRLRQEEDTLSLMVLRLRYREHMEKEKGLMERLASEESKLAGLEAELSSIELQMARLDMELQAVFERRRRLQQVLDELATRKEEAFRKHSDLEKKMALLEQEKSALVKAQAGLEHKAHGLSDTIRRVQTRLEEDRMSLERLEADSMELEEEIARRSSRLSRLKDRREELKDQFVVVASQRAQILERLNSARNRRVHLEDRIERLDEKRQALYEERQGLSDQISSLERELASCAERVTKTESVLLERRKALQEAEALVQTLGHETNRMSARLSEVEARWQALVRIDREGAGLKESTRILRSLAGRRARIVADLLEVEDGYEELVETALGQTIECVVCSEEEGTRLLDRACSQGESLAGAAVLMLESDGAGDRGPKGTSEQIEGLLSQKILGSSEVAEKVRGILASWLVVDRIWDVLKDGSARPGPDGLYVISRDGFVLTPWNELRFAAGGDSGDSGLIIRKKEMKRLEGEKERISRELEALKSRQKDVLQEKAVAERLVGESEAALSRLQREKDGIEHRLSKIRSRLDGLEDRLELVEFEQDEDRRELDDLIPEISRLEKELERAVADESGLKSKLDELDRRLLEDEKAFRKTVDEKNQRALRLQKLEDGLIAGKKELERLQGAVQRSEEEMKRNARRLGQLDQVVEELRSRIEAGKSELETLEKDLRRMERELTEAEEEADEARQKRLVAEKKKADVQRAISKVKAMISSLEIELSGIRKGKEHIGQVCLSQFRRSIAQVLEDDSLRSELDVSQLEKSLSELSRKLESFGPVNLMAMEEYRQLEERLEYLQGQKEDVNSSLEDMRGAIRKIDRECREKFKKALEEINKSLEQVFAILFEGGRAWLSVSDEKNILETGVEYRLRLPGKRINTLSLLSGGEKALAALALIFAIFLIKPTPFCLLDEVDAPLDEANTLKFNSLVRRVSASSQVILVTHNQRVMEMADCLYGVTMEEKGVSKLVTVKMV